MSLFNKLLATDIPMENTSTTKTLQINKVSYDNNLYDYTLKGNTSQQLLPSGYTQLEYIEVPSTDLTYSMPTGLECLSNDKVIIDAYIGTTIGSGDRYLISAPSSWMDIAKSGQAWYMRFGNTSSSTCSIQTGQVGQRNIYELYKEHFDINGTTVLTPAYSSISGYWNIFGPYSNNSKAPPIRAYSYKIVNTSTGALRFNGIPAKNSSNVIGMYDTVTNTFFTNAGTGDFIAGNVTPSPSTPLEVTSVGDKTENILDISQELISSVSDLLAVTKPSYAKANVNGLDAVGDTVSMGSNPKGIAIPCGKGETFSIANFGSIGNPRRYYAEIDSTGVCTRAKQEYVNGATITTTSDNCAFLLIQWSINTPDESQTVVVRGSTAPSSYIPYGYKVPMVVGSNCGCVDLGTINWTRYDTGAGYIFYGDVAGNRTILPGSDVTLYCSKYRLITPAVPSPTFAANGDKVISSNNGGDGRVVIRDDSYTDTTSFKQAMSGVYLYYQRTTDTSWITPTTTNIYLTKPLPKLGNKQDSINYKNQTLTMGTSYYEFTGNETFTSTYSTQFGYVFTCANILSGVQTSATASDMLCTHFRNSGASTDIKFSFTSGTNLNFAVQTTWTSTSDFKAWLTAQKTANTPVTVYYPLQDDVTISVTSPTGGVALPAIPVKSGSNTLEVNTSVTPSEVDATAWCWRF